MINKHKKYVLVFISVLMVFIVKFEPLFASQRYYKITYAPGIMATFNQSLIQNYIDQYGQENVTQSQSTGAITIRVEANSYMPNAPTANDVTFKKSDDIQTYYVLTSGWQPASTKVSENATFVVQYGSLKHSTEYTIRYVDQTTNLDLVSPVISRANIDETIVTYAKVLEGYTFNSQSQSIILNQESSQNIITFYYTPIEQTTQTETIENIVTNRIGTVQATTGQGGITNIPENITPQTSGTDNKTTIADNQTPQVKGELAQNNQKLYTIFGLGVILIIIVGYIIKRKRNEKV